MIIPYIYNHGGFVSEEELKDIFGLSRSSLRKIYDMTLLLGYPPYTPDTFFDLYIDENNPGKVSIWIPRLDILTSPVSFTIKEAYALLSGYKMIARALANEKLDLLMKKISLSFQNSFDDDISETAYKIDFLIPSQESINNYITILDSATKKCLLIEMDYYSASKDSTSARLIEPYLTINHFGNWYIIGRCREKNEYRVFRLDRIKSLSVKNEHFDPRKDFDSTKYLSSDNFYFSDEENNEWIVLRFRKKAANRIKQEFLDAKLQRLPSGDILATLPLRDPAWILSRIRKFGFDVIVESPEDFKKKTIASYEKLFEIYNS